MLKTFFKTIFGILFLLLLSASGYGQTIQNEARFVGVVRPETEDIHNASSDQYQVVLNYIKNSNDRIAIRVCSKAPIPIAFAFAVGEPFRAIEYWADTLANQKVFLLRQNKNCEIKPNLRYLTEYWVVPNTAKFPDFVEIKSAENIKIKDLTFSFSHFDGKIVSYNKRLKLTSFYYKKIELKIFNLLKENNKTLVLLETPNSQRILATALKTKTYLTRRGIKGNRIFVKKNNYFFANQDDKYPNISIIYEK